MTNAYNSIIEYGMTGPEADAYKLTIVYQEEFRRLFPPESDRIDGATYRRNMLPKRGDPRKSNLFRHCWKLLRETRGLLTEQEKRLYVRAQITAVGGKPDAHLEPNILVGDRAWWRWKVYKWLLEKKLASANAEAPPPSATSTDPKIAKELVFTKKFLFEKCDGEPTKEKIDKFITDGIFRFWIMQGKISKFYIALSPWLDEHRNKLAEESSFDLKLMDSKLSDHLRAYFNHEFKHEG